MPSSLLLTKLYAPRLRPQHMPRPRLLERLDAAAACRLTLVSAPPGFGKTTLLADWGLRIAEASPAVQSETRIPHSEIHLAWLTLDAGDSDPLRFLAYLIAALQTVAPTLGEALLAQLQSQPPPPPQVVLTAQINEVAAAPGVLVLVLDDYHLLAPGPAHESVAFLLDHLPPSMRLVIATRADPPLPLSRLRGRGQLAEVRAADLRFTLEETATLLNEVSGLGLAQADVVAMHARTEGWPVALRLLANSLTAMPDHTDRRAFIASVRQTDRFVFDYLAEEVLNRQTPELRQFLLETSILPELTPALCRAVSGREDAGALLEDLYRRNLFLVAIEQISKSATHAPHDTEYAPPSTLHAYRHHALFAGFLRQQLQWELPERVRNLHRRAAEAQTDLTQATPHYLAGEMWDEAAAVIERCGEDALRQGMLSTVAGWIKALPEPVRQAHPNLIHLLGVCAWQRGAPLEAVPLLEQALSRFEAAGDEAGQIKTLSHLVPPLIMSANYGRMYEVSQHALAHAITPASRVQMLMVRGIADVTTGDWRQAIAQLQAALAITEESNDRDAWAEQMIHCMSQFAILPGAIDLVERICQRAMANFGEQPSVPGMAAAARYALVHLLRGRLEQSIQSGERALAISKQVGGVSYLDSEATLALSQAHLARGDYGSAVRFIDMAYGYFQGFQHGQAAVAGLYYLKGRMYYQQGRTDDLRSARKQMDLDRYPGEWDIADPARGILSGLLASAEGREAEAERLLRQVARQQEQSPTSLRLGSARLLLAHLHLKNGRADEALAEFAPVLAECAEQGMPGRILLEGADAAPLLQLAVARNTHAALAGELLEALGAEREPRPYYVPDTGETLSARELEVLRLMAAGLTNPAIAQALVVTTGTVKAHAASIYRKLDVHNRIEAIARARELKLL